MMPNPTGGLDTSQTTGKDFIRHVRCAWTSLPAYLPLALALLGLLAMTVIENAYGSPDMNEYQCYANAFWHGTKAFQTLLAGQCPSSQQLAQFHSFPHEYPPLTLALFSLPLLAQIVDYASAFALLMAILATIIYQLLLHHYPGKAAGCFATGLLVGGLATGLARFDMAPALLCTLCLVLAGRRQWTWANVVLALGVLIKIYPIVLFPLLFLAEQRDQVGLTTPKSSLPRNTLRAILARTLASLRGEVHRWRWKNALVFAGVLLGVSAFFTALSPSGAFSWASHLYLRPFTVESTGSGLIWLASFVGEPVTWTTSFGSLNIDSPISAALGQAFVILLEAGYVYVLIQQWRGKMGFFQGCAAALLLVVVTAKVFSPQYLLWLMPFMAISGSGNRRVWNAWLWICGLTTLIYPFYYGVMGYFHADPSIPGFMPLVLMRNGLLVALTAAYLFNVSWRRTDEVKASKLTSPSPLT